MTAKGAFPWDFARLTRRGKPAEPEGLMDPVFLPPQLATTWGAASSWSHVLMQAMTKKLVIKCKTFVIGRQAQTVKVC